MFGSLGMPEILLILVLALLLFGPKRLPEVGRTIGKGLAEFRRASSDLKRTVNAELALDEDERPRTPRRPDPLPAAEPAPDAFVPEAEPPAATAPRGSLDREGEAPAAPADHAPGGAEPSEAEPEAQAEAQSEAQAEARAQAPAEAQDEAEAAAAAGPATTPH